MTTTKKIVATGATYTAQAPTPNITSSGPTASEIISGTFNFDLTVDSPNILLLDIDIVGLGGENVPDPRLFKFLSDKFSLQEQNIRDVYKNLHHLITTPEQVQKLLEKTLNDIAINSDMFELVWDAYKSFSDSTDNTELVQKTFEQTVQILVNTQDLQTNEVSNYLQDVVALANLSYSIMLLNKFLQHQTVGIIDVLSRIVDFNRIFEDTVFITDDFYGLANIDDDQFADAYKTILTWVGILEVFAVDVTKPDLIDQALANEQQYVYAQISKSDQVLKLDELQFSNLKLLSNYIINLETVLLNTNKLIDTIAVTLETKLLDISHQQQHQVTGLEQTKLSVEIPKTDSVTIQELFIKLYQAVRIVLETISSIDLVTTSFNKAILTGLVTSELYNILCSVNKLETISIVETTLTSTSKPQIDSITQADLATINTNSNKFESVTTLDNNLSNIELIKPEAINSLETVNKLLSQINLKTVSLQNELCSFNTHKINFDLVTFTQLVEKTLSKIFNNQLTTTEQLNYVWNINRLHLELVDATDDFYGLANLDDDQTASFNKTLSHYVNNTETVTIIAEFYRTLLETISNIDLVTNSFNKAILTGLVTSELYNILCSVNKLETISIVETIIKQWNIIRNQTDNITQSDEFKSSINKLIFETSLFSELFTKTITKQLNNASTITEIINKNITTQLLELVDATDDFYGLANLDDDQTASFSKTLSHYVNNTDVITTLISFLRSVNETQNVSEVFAVATNKTFSDTNNSSDTVVLVAAPSKLDTVATSQTISLVLQSYFAEDYVELGYVGETYIY